MAWSIAADLVIECKYFETGFCACAGKNLVTFYHSFNNGLVFLLSKFHGDFCCMRD